MPDDSQFDHFFKDGESFRICTLEVTALLVPGQTPADRAYLIGDAVLLGDTLFMPDVGSALADFPGGNARQLFRSMRRILDLPPSTRVFVCYDYPPEGRAPQWQTMVAGQRAGNIHGREGIDEDSFVAMRRAHDASLEVPTRNLPPIQVDVRAGQLPPDEDNGVSYRAAQ
ncbi:hypothetical protein [Paucibacter sp. PLA-PC-4]|uniref:hypothetical protein n=1 Tax=Paucibacter sp. PLA-PC-4 TaxID=2993655 RepID=UPI002B05A6F9|nr:hypothetical protein [Paucibacter sp. PLA-PC-4]